MCCPSPSNSVIVPDPKTSKVRMFLLWILYGEFINVILKSFLFGLMSGIFNLINAWITYMGYATMHYCQTMIIIFAAVMDMVMAAMSWQQIRMYLQADTMKMIIFWYLFAFAVVKFAVAVLAYSSFRAAFYA